MNPRLRILVVGSGGREHALVWKLAQSPRAERVFCAPGNAGIAQQAECVPIPSSDLSAIAGFAEQEKIDLTVVGPELPLAEGIVDLFQQRRLRIFGANRAAALLESSKVWCKQTLSKYGIPTANFATFDHPEEALSYLEVQELPVVVKADGLAAGKGVTVARTLQQAQEAVRESMVQEVFGAAGRRVVIEEYLAGPEVSVMALSDGESLFPLPSAQDHKPVFDGDQGPNTGGMGCYSPVPLLTDDLARQAMDDIMRPAVRAMAAEGRPYVGCLYGGLVLTNQGLQVLEFNCRFGDPESQVIFPRLQEDLVDLIEAALDGQVSQRQVMAARSASPTAVAARGLATEKGAAVCVVMASGGYPGEYEAGKPVHGLDAVATMPDVVVFHAATKRTSEGLLTAGGRVLGVTGLGDTLPQAIDTAYQAVAQIRFEGAHWRRDIGRRSAGRQQGA